MLAVLMPLPVVLATELLLAVGESASVGFHVPLLVLPGIRVSILIVSEVLSNIL